MPYCFRHVIWYIQCNLWEQYWVQIAHVQLHGEPCMHEPVSSPQFVKWGETAISAIVHLEEWKNERSMSLVDPTWPKPLSLFHSSATIALFTSCFVYLTDIYASEDHFWRKSLTFPLRIRCWFSNQRTRLIQSCANSESNCYNLTGVSGQQSVSHSRSLGRLLKWSCWHIKCRWCLVAI